MARNRYSEEDILNLLRRIELDLNTGSDVESACRKAKSQLQEFKALEKENTRLKRIFADLELDKLILKEGSIRNFVLGP